MRTYDILSFSVINVILINRDKLYKKYLKKFLNREIMKKWVIR